ncbi:MAG: ABC transporter substrate-binding protein [Chloroflexi bacterium]|nr:ABC transporter substrate-binding protein [Chloroflexota bacterium]
MLPRTLIFTFSFLFILGGLWGCGVATSTPNVPAVSQAIGAPAVATMAPTIAAVATTAAPAATNVPQATPGGMAKVRMGYVPVTLYAPLYVAIEKGYFKEQGMEVALTPLVGGSDSVVQLAAGNFDVAAGGVGAGLLNAAARGIDFKMVAGLHSEKPPMASPLVVSKKRFDSGELTKIADLKGKKLAINAKGAATEYWLASALQKGGLTFKDVSVVGLAFSDVPAALENGSLDGAILGEPLVTQAEDKGLVKRLDDSFLNNFQPTVIYYNVDWAVKNPNLAQKWMVAYVKALRYLQPENVWKSDELANILEKYTKVPADVVKRSSHTYYEPDGKLHIEDYNTLQQFFLAQAEVTYKDPIKLESYIDTVFLDAANKALGPYQP